VRTLANRAFLAAKRAPVLLVIEDAHWIDPSTNEFLGEIVSRIHAVPIYVVVTHRAEPDVRLAPHPAPIFRPPPYRSLQCTTGLVRGLGGRPRACHECCDRSPDQTADAPAHRIDARLCVGSACRPHRRTDGRRAAFRRRADPIDP